MEPNHPRKIISYTIAVLIVFPSLVLAQSGGQLPYAGVWGIWGAEALNTEGRPWLKGTMVTTTWNSTEPSNNDFDFGDLDYKLQRAIDNGYEYLMFKIYVGPSTGIRQLPT